MSKEHTINLSCSFCGKSQREVKKLIAGPKVFICDECVGLCHQIIAEEFVREGARPLSPESARAILGSIVAQVGRLSNLLDASATYPGSPFSEPMKQGISALVAAARALRSETERWSEAGSKLPASPAALAVLEPCIATLSTTAEALRTLRPTLDALVPDEGLTMIDEAVRSVLEVRGLLVSVAAK